MSNFFYKMRCGMERFMYGRNGTDQLNIALLVLYVALCLLQWIVVMLLPYPLVSGIFSGLLFATVLVLFFRIFSRNLEKRRRENARFLNWYQPRQHAFSAWRFRMQDRDHKYFKCRACGARCRVPRGKGRIEITCPRCGGKIQGKS